MLKRLKELNINNRYRFYRQFYWLLILSLSFIITISVIKTINQFSRIYEIQRFYNKDEQFGATIVLYNNYYFNFNFVGQENHYSFTNGRWLLNGDTLILNLIGSAKDFTGKDHPFPVFRNAKYLIYNDSIVIDTKGDNSYRILYPSDKYWVNNLHGFWERQMMINSYKK